MRTDPEAIRLLVVREGALKTLLTQARSTAYADLSAVSTEQWKLQQALEAHTKAAAAYESRLDVLVEQGG